MSKLTAEQWCKDNGYKNYEFDHFIYNTMEAYAKQYHQQEMNEFLDAVSDTPENRITLHKQIEQLREMLEWFNDNFSGSTLRSLDCPFTKEEVEQLLKLK